MGAVLKERKRARISELAKYDTVIYGGGIYVGRIAGSGFIRKVYRKLPDKHFVVFSVGFTPHSRVDVLEAARNNSLKGINIEKIDFFHFRGSMDYKKLNLFHRTLLFGKKVSIKLKPEEKLSSESKRFLNQYGKNVAVALDSTQPLIKVLKI